MEYLKDVILAVMVKSATDELNIFMSKISVNIIDKAVNYVPAGSQQRYAEEWKAHLNECPSGPRKIIHSMGCFCYAHRIDPLLMVSSMALIASAFVLALSPLFRKLGDYYLGKAKLCFRLSRFGRQIGAKVLSQRLRRGGSAVARMSFLLFDMHWCCRKFRHIPQHCPAGRSVRDYRIYWKVNALVELWSTIHIAARYSSIPVVCALLDKAPTEVPLQPLPETLRRVNQAKIFPPKRSRIKWYGRIR